MPAQSLYKHTTARHGRMIVFANDTGATTLSLLRYGEWAEQEISFITSLIDEGATVLDVGAYIGTHTLAFSQKVGASGRVIAFEPQPASFRVLERNVALNDLNNVELHEAAVADQHGEVMFQPTDPTSESSFGSAALTDQADPAPDGGVPQVATMRVDDLNLTRCDLIKIDVEGMERSVLEGARRLIDRYRPWLYADCNSVQAGLETWHFLRSHGYAVGLHLTDAFNPANFRGEPTNIFDHAREAALIGIPPGSGSRLGSLDAGSGALVTIQTADDLVLGMLNKPQYVGEILQASAAAASGGYPWLAEHAALRDRRAATPGPIEGSEEFGRVSAQLARTQRALEETQALATDRSKEISRLSAQLLRTQEALEETQALAVDRYEAIGRLESKVEATLAQAAIAHVVHKQEIEEILARTQADAARQPERKVETKCQAATVTDAEAQLAALLESTSWRITRPVRVLGRMLQRR